jgi:hypothetical protein
MTVTDDKLQHHRLRAPVEDGEIFVDPPAEQIEPALAENLAARESAEFRGYDLQGRRLGDLVVAARRELLAAAHRYTSAYREGVPDVASIDPERTSIILSGHQPEMFHPGVWAKHFAADHLAAAHGGVAVTLLIDSDVARSTSLRVPGGTVERPIVEAVPFDAPPGQPVPFEEFRIRDRALFESFGRRAAEAVSGLVERPLVGAFWPLAVERSRATDSVGLCIAQARHQLEGQWGLTTLEVPQSAICDTDSFRWFAAHVLANLPRLFDIYNTSVGEYRRANRIRSKAHPVPDLAADGQWLEAPFWIWEENDPRRRPLFVRHDGDGLVLGDREKWQTVVQLSPDGEAADAVRQLGDLARSGVKIRTRALLTTMFARMFLGDLFIHGIGGAKYDQLTDELIRRFFALAPPHFLALSATLRLPIARQRVDESELRAVAGQLRELRWHPEVFVDENHGAADGELQSWLDRKRRWVAAEQTPQNARQRFLEIRGSNTALQEWVQSDVRRLTAERDRLRDALRREAILASREYAFCLHPEKNLRKILLDNVPSCL